MNVMLLKKGDTGASAYEGWIALGHVGTEADYQEWLRVDGSTKEEVGVAAQLIDDLKGGVSASGDTLLKLYNLMVSSYEEQTVATIAARDAYDITHLPFSLFVLDDGDGLWALYKATTIGVGATFVKLSDYHLLNAIMTAQQVQIAYESNLNTNRYTDAEQAKLAAITGINTGDQDISAMTHANRVALDLVSGVNTGDQDLSGLAIAASVSSALDLKVDKVTGKVLSTNDYSTVEKNKLAAITGINTGDQDITAMTHNNRASLDFVSGVNTGDQDLSGLATSANVTSLLASKVNTVTGKGLSTEDYTTVEKSKLQGIPSNAQKNSDITKAEIEAKLIGTNIITHGHALPLFSSYTTPYTPDDADVILIEKAGAKFKWSWLGIKQALGISPIPPTGNSYYVATDGSDSNLGTYLSPFLTIQHAADIVVPGDTVIVKDGTYTNTTPNYGSEIAVVLLTTNGEAGNWITFRAEHKGMAIIDGSNFVSHHGIMMNGCDYVLIDGFTIKDIKIWAVPVLSCNWVKFDNNHIYNIGNIYITDPSDSNGRCAYLVNSSQNVTIDRNVIHNIGRHILSAEYPDAVNYISQDHGIYMDNVINMTVSNCQITECNRGWAIHAYSSRVVIGQPEFRSENINILHNTIYTKNQQSPGLIILATSIVGIDISNNIFMMSANADVLEAWIVDYNKAVYGLSDYFGDMTGGTIRNNLTQHGIGMAVSIPGFMVSGSILDVDPLVTNLATYDLSIQAGSPAISAGVDVGITYDINNTTRTTIDIGAYAH